MSCPFARLALLAAAFLFGCAAHDDDPRSSLGPGGQGARPSPSDPSTLGQGATASVAPPPSTDLSALRIEHGPLDWGAAPADSGGRRRALLVGADRYRDEPLLDLGKVAPLLGELRATLLDERVGFDRVSVVTGDRVHPDIVQDEIAALTSDLSGPDNHLLVLWVGHGFNDGSGREILLTYRSRAATTSGDPSSLAYDELVAWIAQARTRIGDAGGGLTTSMLLDACRQDSLGTPGRIRDHVPVLDVEAFSAPLGSPAPGGATTEPLWTRALQRALAGARSARVSLLAALERARSEVLRESGGRVEPEIPTGAADVLLVDHDDIALTVRVVDRFTNAPIDGAQVRLNAVERTAPATFAGLARSPEGYALMVRADGYFWRAETIPLARAQAGGTLTVPLAPEFVALVGSVRIEGSGVARVAVTGGFPGLRDGWHVTSEVVDRAGSFLLKLPAVGGERELVIDVNGEEARRRAFDPSTMPSTVVDVDGTRVRVLEFGASVVSARGSVEVGGGTQAVVVGDLIDVRFDFGSLAEADFTDLNGFSFFRTVHVFSDQGAFGKARRDLDTLLSQGKIVTAARPRAEELRHELRVADAMTSAADHQESGRLDEAIAVLDATELVQDTRVRAVLVSWLLASARSHHSERRFGDAVARLDRVTELEPSRTDIDEQRVRVHDDWVGHLYETALVDGSWSKVSALLTIMSVRGAPGVQAWREKVARENISPACRRAYNEAITQLGGGALEDALASFETALAEGCNDHYRGLVAPQLSSLRHQLFDRHVKAGAEREAAGALSSALAEYVAAHVHDRVVTDRIASLLASPDLPRDADVEALARRFEEQEDGYETHRKQRLLGLGALSDYPTGRADVDALRRAAEQRWPTIFASFDFLAVEHHEAGGSEHWIARYRHPSTGLEFALVPGGMYLRGSPLDEHGRQEHESEPTLTTVDPFLVARTEVTREAWQRVMGDDPSYFANAGPSAPLESMTPDAAREFCTRTGLELPTEFQWEYACRAGTSSTLPYGALTVLGTNDSPSLEPVAWYGGNSGVSYAGGVDSSGWVAKHDMHTSAGTHPVGRKAANAFGLHDTLGNVWELCSNTWEGDIGVARGGAWVSIVGECRPASRVAVNSGTTSRGVGFRPVISLPGGVADPSLSSDSDDGRSTELWDSLQLSDDAGGKGGASDTADDASGKSDGVLGGGKGLDAEIWRWIAAQAALEDRTRYAQLGLERVDVLRQAAEQHWPEAFADLDNAQIAYHVVDGVTHAIATYVQRSTGIEFALVPGGTYVMGASEGDGLCGSDELPRRQVTLRPFLIARTEVTQLQWKRAMGNNPSYFANQGETLPVEKVNWSEARDFCERFGLALPTEAEWEYACRAGTSTQTPNFGLVVLGERNAPRLAEIAWYAGNSGVPGPVGIDSSEWTECEVPSMQAGTHPVAGKTSNAFGLHDMIGNVWEWCEDTYVGTYEGAPIDGSARLGEGEGKIVRGGDFSSKVESCRSSERAYLRPEVQTVYVGFRPVRRLK